MKQATFTFSAVVCFDPSLLFCRRICGLGRRPSTSDMPGPALHKDFSVSPLLIGISPFSGASGNTTLKENSNGVTISGAEMVASLLERITSSGRRRTSGMDNTRRMGNVDALGTKLRRL